MRTIGSVLQKAARIAVMLLRRSTNMQDKSIEEQRTTITDWAKANGYVIVAEYLDDAISGDDHAHRAGFERLMQDLKSPDRQWSCILSYDRARFTRADIYEAATYADRILKAGADVIYCVEGKALSTDHEIVWAVDTFQKHDVLKQTSRDTLRGMLALARLGFWCGGPIPYGFDAEIVDKLTMKPVRRIRLVRRKRTLPDGAKEAAIHNILDLEGNFVREVRSSVDSALPLKSEAELTRPVRSEPIRVESLVYIFKAAANRGMGLKGIAKELNGRGVPPPGGHGLWQTSAVKAILENIIYKGIFEWNSRTEAKYNFIQNGAMVPKPRSAKAQVLLHEERDRIRVPMPELALVTPELWHQAQAARALRADKHYREKSQIHTHSILGGKLFCAHCGRKMYGHKSTKTKMVNGKPHTYRKEMYVCSTYLNSGSNQCSYNQVPAKSLEIFILSKIRESLPFKLGSGNLRLLVKARMESLFGRPKHTSTVSLRKRFAELQERVAILERLDSKERAKIGQEAPYHEAKEEIVRISKQLGSHSSHNGHRGPIIDIEAATDEAIHSLGELEHFEALPPMTQKSFFGRFVERVDLTFGKEPRGKRVTSVLKSGLLQLLPLPVSPSFRLTGSGGPLGTRKARMAPGGIHPVPTGDPRKSSCALRERDGQRLSSEPWPSFRDMKTMGGVLAQGGSLSPTISEFTRKPQVTRAPRPGVAGRGRECASLLGIDRTPMDDPEGVRAPLEPGGPGHLRPSRARAEALRYESATGSGRRSRTPVEYGASLPQGCRRMSRRP
jgi:DNA invertase Pin-like site-specific DNA recombinase